MAAPKGNKYNLGGKGTEKHFKTPDELWDAFIDYVSWAAANPWIKKEAIKSGEKVGKLIDVPIDRPLTLTGFAVHCEMTLRALQNYGFAEGYEEYFPVYEKIADNCYVQKFEGASVGTFNASIIARDLGLKEHTEQTGNLSIKWEESKTYNTDE